MAWDLDIDNYSVEELMDLFGIENDHDTDMKIDTLIVALNKVKHDKYKTPEECAAFQDFVFNVADVLGIAKQQMLMSIEKMTDIELKDMLFNTKQPFTQVNEHVILSEKSRKDGILNDKEGHSVTDSRYPSGVINPNKIHTLYKAINIDSRFRDSYYTTQSGSFHVNLPTKINECVKIQLSNLTIPLTMHGFSEKLGNTTFVITTTDLSAATTRHVITIPDGNYTTTFYPTSALTRIEDMINTRLNAAGINPATDVFFNIDKISGRSVFMVPSGSTTVSSFKVEFAVGTDGVVLTDDDLQLRLGWALGFRIGTYIGNPSGSVPATVISEGICIPSIPRYIFLAVDDFQSSGMSNYYNSGYQSSLLPNNILSRLDIGNMIETSGSYTLSNDFNYKNNTLSLNSSRTYFGPVTLEKLKLSLYDEYGRIIDLNNMDWSVSFSVECIYE